MNSISGWGAILLWPLFLGQPGWVSPHPIPQLRATNGAPMAAVLPPGAPLQAIVQLRDLQLPSPQVKGQATLPLQPLADSRSFTLTLTSGGETGTFVLDTGASTTIISSDWVRRLGLRGQPIPRQKFDLAMAGDDCPALNATLHQLPRMGIAGVEVKGLPALEFSKAFLPDGIAGVLGMNLLNQFDLKVNPQSRQLQLLPVSRGPLIGVPLEQKLGVMYAQVKINGQGPFRFLLDTGADSVFMSQQLAQQLKLDQLPRQPLNVLGFCGLEKAEQVTLAQVELQQHRQTNLEGIILSSPIMSRLQVDGILGQAFFNHYSQHWRFSDGGSTLNPKGGSLNLIPLPSRVPQGVVPKVLSPTLPQHPFSAALRSHP
jgi:predicted aspartyl protease